MYIYIHICTYIYIVCRYCTSKDHFGRRQGAKRCMYKMLKAQAEVPSQSDPRSMGFVDQRRDIHGKPWKTCKMIKHGGRDSIHNHDKVQFFAFKPISQSVYLL